jgi:hypothetical protein
VGAGTVTSDVPQVLQKRAVGVLLAPHLGHVTTDIVYETNSFPVQLLELTFEVVGLVANTSKRPSSSERLAGLTRKRRI